MQPWGGPSAQRVEPKNHPDEWSKVLTSRIVRNNQSFSWVTKLWGVCYAAKMTDAALRPTSKQRSVVWGGTDLTSGRESASGKVDLGTSDIGDIKVPRLDEMNEAECGEKRGRGTEPQGGEVGLARG